ncbi:FtsX-like permease family protein [Actinomadura oligospora]|uniref:FtsX-like permease family protein n=1 Tax=Actinomadura oligospora TaxID=111804 RepID=UPI0004B6A768|nr:FtsX-like permease family protein [Actinomadura oligospora]
MSAPAFRSIRTRLPALLALAVLIALTTGLAVVVPARVVHGFDRSAVAAAGPDGAVNVTGRAKGGNAFGKIPAPDELVRQGVGWRNLLPPGIARATDDVDPYAYIGPDMVQRTKRQRPGFLRLFVNPSLRSHVRFLSGDPDSEQDNMPGPPGIFITQKVAALFELKVGSPVRVETGSGVLALRVAGIIEANDPESPYWTARQAVTKPWIYVDPRSGYERQFGGALMGPKGYSALRALGAEVNYTWRFPLRQDRVTAASLRDMVPELDRFRSSVSGRSDSVPSEVQTPMDARIREFAGQYSTAQVITGLAFGGLAAVLAGSVLTGLVLFAERLRGTLAIMRARGASRAQLFGTVSWLTAPVLVPAVALGYGLGWLIHAGPHQLLSAYLAVGIALLVVVVPWASAVGWRRRGAAGASPRPENAAVRPSRRRLVFEGLVVVLAVIATVAMRRRGLAVQSELGADPLLSVVPVLLGVGAGLLVLRVLPWPLRFAGRLLGRGRSAVGFVGLARASRRPVLTLVPTIVLLLATAVAGFGSAVGTALVRGQKAAAWHSVGSDARITAGALGRDLPGRLSSVRGVTGTVPLRTIPEAVVGAPAGQPGPRVIVIAVDLAAYKKIAGGSAKYVPDAPAAPDGALASPSAAAFLGKKPTTLAWVGGSRVAVRPSGIAADLPGMDSADRYVIIPYRLLQGADAFPTQVFVQGHGIDRAALDRAANQGLPEGAGNVGEGFIRYHDDIERAMVQGPMAQVMHRAFSEGALLVAVFGLLTVLFTLLVGARERGRAVAHLEVQGLGRRQRRLLAIAEAGPAILSAVLAGWLLGLLLPRVTGPMMDLRPYTSGFTVTNHAVDPVHLVAFAGVLPAVALAAVLVDRIFDARHRLGEVLRTGEEG